MAAERRRERWEMDHVPEREKQEMIDVYVNKGVTEADAMEVVNLLWPHKEAFLGISAPLLFASGVDLPGSRHHDD